MNYVLGLDIGIASVGWAVIDLETLQVIESCSNIFTAAEAENNKDRRSFRQMRRLKRRLRTRISDFAKMWKSLGFSIPGDIDNMPLLLRVKGISEELSMDEIYTVLLNELKHRGMSELWDMVQKSSIVPYNDNEYLENKSGNELVNIYLNSLEKSQEIFPERTLVIFRDLDHLVKKSEYCDLVYRMKNISDNYDVHFIISSSIDGYCWLKNGLETGVTVFNDVIYGIPDMYHIKEFIENNYPYNRELEYDELIEMLQNVIHKIGGKGELVSISDLVILKLINESLAINECITKSPVEQEISFLLT